MLKAKIQEDQTRSLKEGNKKRLDAIRYIMSRIKNEEIEKRGELEDDEVVKVLRKVRSELGEAISAYKQAGRDQQVQENQAQLEIVESYLPKEASDKELETAIRMVIEKNQELYDKNPSALIGICVKELKDKADSQRIVKIFKSIQ